MDSKQLTIAIPAYNAEPYLKRCLDSFISGGKMDDRLELIVVDDGSADKTAEIAGEYRDLFPDDIKVISKENGGHGSAINEAFKLATGRYFKAVDSDDWVITENIPAILDELVGTGDDVVVTGYISVNEKNGRKQVYSTKGEWNGRTLGMDEFADIFDGIPASFQYHGLCFNTEFYKGLGLLLSEGVFYEDQEYAVLPFLTAETIRILSEELYVYRLGGSEQSVSSVNMQNRLGDLKAVLKKMLDRYDAARRKAGWTEARERFFKKRLSIAFGSFFAITLVKTDNKKAGKKEAEGFMQFVEANNKDFAEYILPKYQTLQKLGRIPGLAALYGKIADSRLYLSVKKKWVR